MYVFFDTETTGIPLDHNAPASDVNNWPRVVQIAWTLIDSEGRELRSQAFIVRPDGFEIPLGASRIHGITTERARSDGVDIALALGEFSRDVSDAHALVAHNVQFDERVVSAEFYRAGHKQSPLKGKDLRCTMRSSTDFCRLPGGRRGFKWPTLDQLHRILFGASFGMSHNATADVRACVKCYFELQRRGVIPADVPIGRPSPDPDDGVRSVDEELFEEIYELAGGCPWFDTGRFVDCVHSQFEKRGFLTAKQRDALIHIRDMLEEKSG
jgi:DNA polymerase III epsilon subunit-like protein